MGRGRGTGGNTASCALRSAEVGSAAAVDVVAVPSMGAVDGGVDLYALFLMHCSVVCEVELGW